MMPNEEYVTNDDDNLVHGFDKYNCSGDSGCDIFKNEDEIITEDYIFYVNIEKNNMAWEVH